MLPFKEVKYVEKVPTNITCILVADVGGTNCNFGIFKPINGFSDIILSMHFKTKDITDFSQVVVDVLEYLKKTYTITIKNSCLAVAGVVSENRDYSKTTNADIVVDANDILKKTNLECAIVVNDFQVIGHGIDHINPKDLILVHEGKPRKTWARAVLGAGTGLGKNILIWDNHLQRYLPNPSEGGHADFVAQDDLEIDLIKFLKPEVGHGCNVSWEDVLSGSGTIRIFTFFNVRAGKEPNMHDVHPDMIFKNRNNDPECRATYELYAKLYARCVKNFALDVLALGGVYIAGGIASNNIDMFKEKIFIDEFINCGKQMELLRQVPIYVIADYNVSLYGAAMYLTLEGLCRAE